MYADRASAIDALARNDTLSYSTITNCQPFYRPPGTSFTMSVTCSHQQLQNQLHHAHAAQSFEAATTALLPLSPQLIVSVTLFASKAMTVCFHPPTKAFKHGAAAGAVPCGTKTVVWFTMVVPWVLSVVQQTTNMSSNVCMLTCTGSRALYDVAIYHLPERQLQPAMSTSSC